MREPAARRFLQGPRRLRADGQADRRGEEARRRRRLGRQPRPGRGGGREERLASRPASTCRWASPCPSWPPPAAMAPRWCCTATTWTKHSPRPNATRTKPARSSSTPSTTSDIVAGQGTVGLEILEQVPNVDTILMGVGGGGLLAGVAVAVKARAKELGREIRSSGCRPKTPPPTRRRWPRTPSSRSNACPPWPTASPWAGRGSCRLQHHPRTRRRRRHRQRRRSGPGADLPAGTGQDGGRTRRRRRRGRPDGRQDREPGNHRGHPLRRQHRPDADAQGHPARPLRRRPLHDRADDARRPTRLAGAPSPGSSPKTTPTSPALDHTRMGGSISMGDVSITVNLETKGHEHCELVLGALRAEGFQPIVVALTPWPAAVHFAPPRLAGRGRGVCGAALGSLLRQSGRAAATSACCWRIAPRRLDGLGRPDSSRCCTPTWPPVVQHAPADRLGFLMLLYGIRRVPHGARL